MSSVSCSSLFAGLSFRPAHILAGNVDCHCEKSHSLTKLENSHEAGYCCYLRYYVSREYGFNADMTLLEVCQLH